MKRVLAAGMALILAAGAARAWPAAQERQALLIGNGAYQNAPEAQTAVRDVRSVAEALRAGGLGGQRLGRPRPRRDARGAEQLCRDRGGRRGRPDLLFRPCAAHRRAHLSGADRPGRRVRWSQVLFDGVPLELVLRIAEDGLGRRASSSSTAPSSTGSRRRPSSSRGSPRSRRPRGRRHRLGRAAGAGDPPLARPRQPFRAAVVDRFLAPGAEVMATADEVGCADSGSRRRTGRTALVLAPQPEPSPGRAGQRSRAGDRARLLADGRALRATPRIIAHISTAIRTASSPSSPATGSTARRKRRSGQQTGQQTGSAAQRAGQSGVAGRGGPEPSARTASGRCSNGCARRASSRAASTA